MAQLWNNLFCRSGGSNLNSGSRNGTAEPGTAADFTYPAGSWLNATNTFTAVGGDPLTDGVAVGDFVSLYADGSTVTGYVARVTAVTVTTIVLSPTAKAGTAPIDGTFNRTVKVGGAWNGPNGTEKFPFNFIQNTLTNILGYHPRVNLKNDQVYAVTAGLTHTFSGPIAFEGYSVTPGDGGLAEINGGTSGASYTLLTMASSGAVHLTHIRFKNNGATGAATMVLGSTSIVRRCTFTGSRGVGYQTGGSLSIECEAYGNNLNNSAGTGAITTNDRIDTLIRCISHDNVGSNTSGFLSTQSAALIGCIADGNGQYGFNLTPNNPVHKLLGCEVYNNGSHGLNLGGTNQVLYLESCNFLNNGGFAVGQTAANPSSVIARNCGFGSGTQANTSGNINPAIASIDELDSIIYAADATPWVDPDNGDFRIVLGSAKQAGRGQYLQDAAGYAGTIGYPDIGSAQAIAGNDQAEGARNILIGGGFG